MIHITNSLNDYILTNVLPNKYDVIYEDIFPDDEAESLISRTDPSSAKESEFVDGSAVGSIQLSYYCRSANAKTARDNLTALLEGVDNITTTDEDGTKIRISVQTLPNFVSVDDKNNTVYSVTLNCDYERPTKELK